MNLLDGRIVLHGGDNREVLKTFQDNSIDSVVTDGPYALVSVIKRFGGANAAPAKGNEAYMRASKGFMGKTWDTGEVVNDPGFWSDIYRVLKPGGHLLSFGGTRTAHRMICAVEDAGFEIRDMIAWLYGTGFPKSHDVSKGIDKAAGAERTEVVGKKTGRAATPVSDMRGGKMHAGGVTPGVMDLSDIYAAATPEAAQWEGWGTALKPALEPICLARKPLEAKTVAGNILSYGTGAINIDGCRVNSGPVETHTRTETITAANSMARPSTGSTGSGEFATGRFPANVITDGSDEVVMAFPVTAPAKAGLRGLAGRHDPGQGAEHNRIKDYTNTVRGHSDNGGSAARFFYSAKANKKDRANSKHPTVKPVALMRYLCRLITPPGGTVLDPFAGSGTTGEAALLEGFNCIMIERESEYLADIFNRFTNFGAAPEPANDNELSPQIDLEDAIAQVAA